MSELIEVKSQDEIDAGLAKIRLEKEKLLFEKEQLEMIKLRADVAEIQAKMKSLQMAHEAVEESLTEARRREQVLQNGCSHLKGGKGETLLGGAPGAGTNASNWALIQHTFGDLVTIRFCQRCGKTWYPGDPNYREIMSKPTSNSPSSSSLVYGLIKHPETIKRTSA